MPGLFLRRMTTAQAPRYMEKHGIIPADILSKVVTAMKWSRSLSSGLIALALLTLSLLAGCAGTPTAVPTPMPNQETIVALAVQTLAAQMTQEAINNPSPTPTSTSTPEPTPTATEVPPTPTQAPPTETATVTPTSAPAVSAKFLTASTYPENKYEYVPNERFSISIRFQNTGTTTWESGSRLVLSGFENHLEGDTVTVQKEATISKAVAPGDVAEFDLWAFGSETLGRHVWYFQLLTASGGSIPGGYASFAYEAK